MMRHKKYEPYVRLANGKERSESLRESFRLAYYRNFGKPFYVMVQRGFPNDVICVGRSKRDVQMCPATVAFGRLKFREWSRAIGKGARDHS